MKWFSRKKKVALNEFVAIFLVQLFEFKQIYKDLDDLLTEEYAAKKKSDKAVIEMLYIRAFVVTKILNTFLDKKVSHEVLDKFHDAVFSTIKNGALDINSETFATQMNERYAEYYEILGKIEKPTGIKEDSSFALGHLIATNILGIEKTNDEYLTLDFSIAMKCYIYLMTAYNAQAKMISDLIKRIEIV